MPSRAPRPDCVLEPAETARHMLDGFDPTGRLIIVIEQAPVARLVILATCVEGPPGHRAGTRELRGEVIGRDLRWSYRAWIRAATLHVPDLGLSDFHLPNARDVSQERGRCDHDRRVPRRGHEVE